MGSEMSREQREVMSAHTATAARTRTGGPQDDGPKIVEHVAGWTLVVVLAMLVAQLGLL
ncbi:SCO1431 family membrane protein [Streptomyces sp. SW4]|nr:SCO1431 family membrane protein [Streptomyces sp. SW4]